MFLPKTYQENVDFEEIDLDEFLDLLAKAKIAQRMQISIINQAIASAFSDE